MKHIIIHWKFEIQTDYPILARRLHQGIIRENVSIWYLCSKMPQEKIWRKSKFEDISRKMWKKLWHMKVIFVHVVINELNDP